MTVITIAEWRIRTKQALVMAMPFLLLCVLLGIRLNDSIQDTVAFDELAQELSVSSEICTLVQALQLERSHVAEYMTSASGSDRQAGAAALIVQDRTATDTAESAVLLAMGSDPEHTPGEAYQTARAALARLHEARTEAGADGAGAESVFDQYSRVIEDLLSTLPEPSRAVDSASLASDLDTLADVARYREYGSRLRVLLAFFSPSVETIAALVAREALLESSLQDTLIDWTDSDRRAELESLALSGVRWLRATATDQAHLSQFEHVVLSSVLGQASELRDQKNDSSIWLTTAIMFLLLSAFLAPALVLSSATSSVSGLAARGHRLVERQLLLLDRLESTQTDPEQLDNLFRLDHLAAQMRRVDAGILALAGQPAPSAPAEPVSLADVVLASIAESDHYTGIIASPAPMVLVTPSVVMDLVHLLAELLDSAVSCSDQSDEVRVATELNARGEVRITITYGEPRSALSPAATNHKIVQTLADRSGVAVTADQGEGRALGVVLPPSCLVPAQTGDLWWSPAVSPAPALSAPPAQRDPQRVGMALSDFYNGVHLAESEPDQPNRPADDRGDAANVTLPPSQRQESAPC